MSTISNIQYFERVVFEVVTIIANTFPDDVSFDADSLLPPTEYGHLPLRKTFCFNSVRWLERNNYIFVTTSNATPAWFNVLPTDKLMSLMGVIPPSLQGSKQTLWDFFRESAKAGSGAAISDAVKMLLFAGARALS